MKHIHHLKARWLIATTLIALIAGETAAWYVCRAFDLRFSATAIGALSVGVVVATVSMIYDGTD